MRKIENGFIASIPTMGRLWYAPTAAELIDLLRQTVLPELAKPAKNIGLEVADELISGLAKGLGLPPEKIKAAMRDQIEAQSESELWRQAPDGDDDPTA